MRWGIDVPIPTGGIQRRTRCLWRLGEKQGAQVAVDETDRHLEAMRVIRCWEHPEPSEESPIRLSRQTASTIGVIANSISMLTPVSWRGFT
jgi:hypothetical protein